MTYSRTILLLITLIPLTCFPKLNSYKDTNDNGMNKRERISNIENYLQTLASKIESDGNSRIKNIGKQLKEIKAEISKLKTDFSTLKKESGGTSDNIDPMSPQSRALAKLSSAIERVRKVDVGRLRVELREMKGSIEAIQETLAKSKAEGEAK